jgi:hypothetical protein
MTTDYEKLAAPFDRTFKKPGSNAEYATGEQYITRLNGVLGVTGWSFEVKENGYHLDSDEVWALGKLTIYLADGTTRTREQFGSQKHNRYTRGDNAGQIIDLGFDLKGAATDALKKCASLIGVGLYLSEKEGGQEAPKTAQAPQKPASAPKPSMEEWAAQMGYAWDHVVSLSQQMFENKEPRHLGPEQKKRLSLALEEEKKKAAAA